MCGVQCSRSDNGVTVGIAAVQNRSRLKNKCKPNDMKRNSKSQAGHSSNTLVGGCLSPIEKLESIMSKFGEAHSMLARTKLSKEEYQPISSLLATAKVELFNYYYELKTGVQK